MPLVMEEGTERKGRVKRVAVPGLVDIVARIYTVLVQGQ